ncbi:MAG: tRNA and rRNA cytosine-C5-methylase [Faecalibacterium sp. CAG:82-related_59_9]|nr:MAG: tRNA and rRNA cytosine-C5-methylase [Faecalibacterium sp. CAG:82-related_59_9]
MPTEYFEARERALLGQRYETLYAAPSDSAARGVTVSALRTTPGTFAAKADMALEPSPFCKAAFVVREETFKPGRHPYHHAGVFYSQEPSAASAAPLLGVKPGMRVLDLCAAPGGKSSQLAAALQGQGLLVSNEYVAARADIVPNAVILNEAPARIAEALPEFFDRVLVDAPCSGEGMFRKEAVAVTQHSEALVKQCAELGAQILDCAAAVLAPGGQLVYSTCTFAPEEDEGQVAAFLQRHPEFTLADALGNVDYTFGSEGEANRTGGLPLDVTRVRRVWPCQGGEGHFMARLVKAGTPRAPPAPRGLEAAAQAGKKAGKGKGKPAKSFDKADARSARREASRSCHEAVQGRNTRTRDAGAGEATPAQSLAAWQEFAARYFPALAQRPAVVHGGGVLLPVPFPQTTLHVLRAGVFVGSVQKGRFVPEHHLFTAFGAQCTNREELTLTDPRTVEYLSGREIEARTAADGWCCVTVDGWPLGGGKVSGGRVKNHYPKALRLL